MNAYRYIFHVLIIVVPLIISAFPDAVSSPFFDVYECKSTGKNAGHKSLRIKEEYTHPESYITVIKTTISRAEIHDRIINNLDEAMEGIKGGPYKINGEIVGFRIIRIRPGNILYIFGIRRDDIIRRFNGKTINSTEKLLNMWEAFRNGSRIVLDVERHGVIINIDITITD